MIHLHDEKGECGREDVSSKTVGARGTRNRCSVVRINRVGDEAHEDAHVGPGEGHDGDYNVRDQLAASLARGFGRAAQVRGEDTCLIF